MREISFFDARSTPRTSIDFTPKKFDAVTV